MKYTPAILREILRSLVRKLGETPEQFVRRPGRDFTRPRTLSFETVISLLLTMSENSVGKVLIERFKNREDTPSASAFVQQREKLLPGFSRKSNVKADKQSSRKQKHIKGLPRQGTAQLNRAYPPVFRDEGRYARAA